MDDRVSALLDALAVWAADEPSVRGLALVGSHARGTAQPHSDVDLVILCDDAHGFVDDPAWPGRFGRVERMQREPYGLLTALRVIYADGLEVEFGLAEPAWAAVPLDAGTARVLRDGCRILYDPRDRLAGAVGQVRSARSAANGGAPS